MALVVVRVAALPVVLWLKVGHVKVPVLKFPDVGVPRAHPLTTGAPADPTATARAVATPVPSPVTHHTATAEAVAEFPVQLADDPSILVIPVSTRAPDPRLRATEVVPIYVTLSRLAIVPSLAWMVCV